MPEISVIPARNGRGDIIRAAAYASVSSSSDDQLNSFNAQIRYYTELLKNNTYTVFVDMYSAEGITGTYAAKRNEFQQLMSCCRICIQYIIAWRTGLTNTPQSPIWVFRVLENPRYFGSDGCPRLVSDEEFNAAAKLKVTSRTREQRFGDGGYTKVQRGNEGSAGLLLSLKCFAVSFNRLIYSIGLQNILYGTVCLPETFPFGHISAL